MMSNKRSERKKVVRRDLKPKTTRLKDIPLGSPMSRLDFGKIADLPTIVRGPGAALPPFKDVRKVHKFRFQVLGSAFKTKSGLTGSQIKGAAAPYSFALNFSIGDCPFNPAGLFDQFRISRIRVRIASSKNTNTTGIGALLYVVKDYDNSNALTSVANAQTYESCTVVRGSDAGEGEQAIFDIIPCIPVSTNAGNMIVPSPWQDLANITNSHYGVKGWYATAATTDPVFDVDAQYWIECTNTQ